MPSWSDFWSVQPEPGRAVHALEGENTPLTLSDSDQSATFAGSEGVQYVTSMSSCTCTDFSITNLPCKHITRLAMCLGLFPSHGMVSDLPSALIKYEFGLMISFVKTAPIQKAIELVKWTSYLFSTSKKKFTLHDIPLPQGCFLFDVVQGIVVPKKQYKKNIKTLEEILLNRISNIIRIHLDNHELVSLLVDLDIE